MPTADTTDVTSKLTVLERRLIDLERELGAIAAGAPTAPGPPPRRAPVAAPPDAAARVESLRGEIADLLAFRDRLEAAARELVSEYEALVARLDPRAEARPTEQHEERTYVGAVEIDAGPFDDLAALRAFERGLAGVDGARDVRLRRFERDRGLFDVRLAGPVPLVRRLRERLATPVRSTGAVATRLTLDLEPPRAGRT